MGANAKYLNGASRLSKNILSSLREVLRVTCEVLSFLTKASFRESSKPTGRSASEPRCSLENHNGVVDPVMEGGRPEHLS